MGVCGSGGGGVGSDAAVVLVFCGCRTVGWLVGGWLIRLGHGMKERKGEKNT